MSLRQRDAPRSTCLSPFVIAQLRAQSHPSTDPERKGIQRHGEGNDFSSFDGGFSNDDPPVRQPLIEIDAHAVADQGPIFL